MEKEVKVNGHTYRIKPYNHESQILIDDGSWTTVVLNEKGDTSLQRKVGSYLSLIIFHSLVSWDVKGKDEKIIPLNYDNFRKFFPPGDRLKLSDEASEINKLGESEKNLLSGKSAEK